MKKKETQACDVTENRFRTILTLLRMAGVPINMKKVSILNSIYNVFTAINGYAMYLAFYVDIIIHNDDLKNFMKTFRVLTATSQLYWLHLNLSWRLRDFERLLRLTESFTWEDQPTRDPHTGHRTLAGWIPHLQIVTKYAYAFTAFYHLVQSGVRMYISHELMYPAWYPFDTVSSPGYELVIVMQIFESNFYTCILIGFPLLYATLVMVACTQLQKLRTDLLDIKQEMVPSGADSGSDGGEEPVSRSKDGFCRMQMQLNECVRHHQAILQYVITFTVHVSSLQEVVKAERVRDAAWGCDWVGTPVPFQRCLAFIIATANKEFTLTAGKFVPVSNSTMMSNDLEDVEFLRNLAFLTDITQHLNVLNLQLQGKKQTICQMVHFVDSFHKKLHLFKSALDKNNLLQFPCCRKLSEEEGLEFRDYTEIIEDLSSEFDRLFNDFESFRPDIFLFSNLYIVI
ncbi:hypothetical protein B7P43_G08632 [Cryptotermes secundus]|uniref:Odorant receptor n=1 Tax=Cryptotermes secundus TaxID=105785 RepID=A0A2J7Q612_9NEOP|nr:hypothetical protein B7P43_G08632 [Cryptotermes secundus]